MNTLEITDPSGELVGILVVDVDGFCNIHSPWLRKILDQAGYTYEDSKA